MSPRTDLECSCPPHPAGRGGPAPHPPVNPLAPRRRSVGRRPRTSGEAPAAGTSRCCRCCVGELLAPGEWWRDRRRMGRQGHRQSSGHLLSQRSEGLRWDLRVEGRGVASRGAGALCGAGRPRARGSGSRGCRGGGRLDPTHSLCCGGCSRVGRRWGILQRRRSGPQQQKSSWPLRRNVLQQQFLAQRAVSRSFCSSLRRTLRFWQTCVHLSPRRGGTPFFAPSQRHGALRRLGADGRVRRGGPPVRRLRRFRRRPWRWEL